jgi:hypothetical protein
LDIPYTTAWRKMREREIEKTTGGIQVSQMNTNKIN